MDKSGKKIDDTLTDVWKLVKNGQNYNERIGYYETVDENYAYVRGDQWRGVESNGLPKPVINILKRVRDYKVSSIMSQSIKGTFSCENIKYSEAIDKKNPLTMAVEKMNNYVEILWEREKVDSKLRECLMDGFTTGDYAMYVYWDKTKETGQDVKGDICIDVVDAVNVLFGNPNCHEVEKQPYIVITGRDTVHNLKEEAKRNGISKSKYDSIAMDSDTEYTAGDEGKEELDGASDLSDKATYAIKFWKENGSVWFKKSTKFCDIQENTNMEINRYPIAFGNWEKIKNSYHGQADATGMLPNQRYINKQYAMLMLWMMYNALGKVAYDSTRINGWSNQIGTAIPVEGDLAGAVQQIPPTQFNTGVLDFLSQTMSETLNAIGVNDVVMGDIKPENTSAIIAVQKQSAVPLENVQANLYQFVEDLLLIVAEFIVSKYNIDRNIMQRDEQGEEYYVNFNSAPLKEKLMRVKVDVGASSMWSEITSLQTLDNLLQNQQITFLQYLERIPNGIIPKKQELIDEIKKVQEEAEIEQETNSKYEDVARQIEGLPPEIQQQFMSLPPEQQNQFVQEYLQQQAQQSIDIE